MSNHPGDAVVILRRLDALAAAIRARDWQGSEFCYDQVRSAVERTFGIRNRPTDRLRKGHDG